MAASVVTYSAVAAKLRAMYSRILTSEDYELLMNKSCVSDVFLWLKNHSAYGEIFHTIHESSIHRGQIERVFGRALFDDAYSISLMLPQNNRKMLEAVLAKADIQLVKRVIRAIHTQIPLDLGTVRAIYKKEHMGISFDVESVITAKTYDELAEALKGTPLYKVIKPFLSETVTSTFELENALDQCYFTMLNKSADTYLRGQDRKWTKEFLAAEVDMHNLLRSYRYKKYYSYSGEKMLAHLFPNKYKLKPEFWKTLADSDSKDFRKLAMNTKYRRLFREEDDASWYREVSQAMADSFRKHFRENPYNFTAVICYLFLKEIAIQNLITIIEGVRYALTPKEIRGYLVTIK